MIKQGGSFKSKKTEVVLYIAMFIFLVYLFVSNRSDAFLDMFYNASFYDFKLRWKECAYVLKGINPTDVARGLIAPIAEIGVLPVIAGTVPWAYLLGNFFVFGFLEYKYAMLLGSLLFLLIPAITLYVVKQNFDFRGIQFKFFVFFILILVLNPHWIHAYRYGNYGALFCCILTMLPFMAEKHPWVTGVLHALCMIKPQLAALFYLIFLLKRQWKSFFLSGGIISASWLVTCFLVSRNPLNLLFDIYNTAVGSYSDGVFGLIALLEIPRLSRGMEIFGSAMLGIIFVVTAFFLSKRYIVKKNQDIFLYSATAVASTFWFYKQPHDYIIIQLLFILILILLAELKSPMLQLAVCFFVSIVVQEKGLFFISRILNINPYLVCYIGWIGLLLVVFVLMIDTPKMRNAKGWINSVIPTLLRNNK